MFYDVKVLFTVSLSGDICYFSVINFAFPKKTIQFDVCSVSVPY